MHSRLLILFLVMGALNANVVFAGPGKNASNSDKLSVGAYYFDGWSGVYPTLITKQLTDSFSKREPKWGWITSSQNVVDEQIELASGAGLSFFSFCWYYKKGVETKKEPLNHALNYYLASKNKDKLKFCLMIANHSGSGMGPEEWPEIIKELIDLFKDKQYQTIEGKPLLVFFSQADLIKQLGSAKAVNEVFTQLRNKAKENGLPGVSIAVSVDEKTIQSARDCGFDILTGYNNHSAGFQNRNGKQAIPIDSLQKGEYKVWDNIIQKSTLPYIPVVTLNWDPRPWATPQNGFAKDPYYVGLSSQSVYKSMMGAIKWVNNNKLHTTKEKMILIYAWNENGEGAYLTPSKNGDNFLGGLKKAISFDKAKKQ